MIYNGKEMLLHFDLPNNSIADLGYLLVDITHILSFCDHIEKGNISYARKAFTNSKYINRHSHALAPSSNFKIRSISNGSVVIILEGVGVLAAIIMPLVAIAIASNSQRRSQMITFNVETEFKGEITRIIDDVNTFPGINGENINLLFDRLSANGYSVHCDRDDAYTISKILNTYVKRMATTVYKINKYR